MSFDRVLMVDWSGGNDRGATPKKDAIWTCFAGEEPLYHRNRQVAEGYIVEVLENLQKLGQRCLIGFDLCFAYPKGFAQALTGSPDPFAVWDWFEARVQDGPKGNNRFHLAGQINSMFPGQGPFWFNALKEEIDHLPRKGSARKGHGLAEFRATDQGAFSSWQLAGAGAVGGQVIMGLPMLARLRRRFGAQLSVWPFERPETPLVLAETYFSLLRNMPLTQHPIKDAAQVQGYANLFAALSADDWAAVFDQPYSEEGWVLGKGAEARLETYLPGALRNDCFALPAGVHWTPVDAALDHLRANLGPVTARETVSVAAASGRILAEDVTARRSHPPTPNSAVDGWGINGAAPEGAQDAKRLSGRAAAGAPFHGAVRPGEAVRILTGAALPEGVDRVILQEDVTVDGDHIRFAGPIKAGANTRKAGEDMIQGDVILRAKSRITAGDIGMLTAAGLSQISVRRRLRVGVLSTGDELRDANEEARPEHIFDANRPLLLSLLHRWGLDAVDLGRAPDQRDTVKSSLNRAAALCDVILTSGGASGGDEDHMSALLQDTGSFALWRIAVKPGRPLAFGLWQKTPVIALPGNPVAAFVCTLIFGKPALDLLAGAEVQTPQGFDIPAAFSMRKKAGRREFLRARVEGGIAERFASEGSGRVSGLSWATGLIELPDHALDIAPGDPVRFLPFGSFGL